MRTGIVWNSDCCINLRSVWRLEFNNQKSNNQ